MQLKLDDKVILDINETMIKILAHDLGGPVEEIERRAAWAITCKLDACFERLKGEWDRKLAARGIEMIPTDKEKYAQLVFSQPDYKNRLERDGHLSGY